MKAELLRAFVLSLVCVVIQLIGGGASAQTYPNQELKNAILEKERYVREKQQVISSLRRRLIANQGAAAQVKFDLNNALYQQYKSFIFDSAFFYSNRLIELGYEMNDKALVGYSKTNLGFTLLSAGMFKEAFDTLNTVIVKELPDSTKVEFYALMARALYDNSDYNQDNYYSELYVKNANSFVDFAISLADPDAYHYLYLNGLRNLRVEKTDEAIQYLNKLLNADKKISSHEYAITASTLSYLHLKLGDTSRAVNLLASACVSDIQSAIKETSALTSLAQLMYETGDIEQAYLYINESMSDARYYGAIQRMSQVGNILPIISAAKLNNVDSQRRKLLIYSIGLSILVVLTVAFAMITILQKSRLSKKDLIIKQNNDQLREANTLLSETSKIKDEYLGFYFDSNARNLNKMSDLKKSIESKLLDKKYDDIRYVLKKLDLKKEHEELFNNFDEAFVKIFPNFINRFNSLFEEDKQFHPEKGQILSPEIRIFALIRIGITDSDRLANILGYSVNTIYAYKNRIKSQSTVPNNEFEDRVMNIQSKETK
ncbi:hypothetical protein SAMN04488029_3562 [Reichenbachiella faecimaris]|uniref:DUF6377 domain-containing protein n=1 Tax=Reichenbachiella faecimaris TaxID=692418 RepID=A0A1W2GMZ0_REIFA|nr:DUF6377 domain-containing protein [Reichenbachiella faecimaris]SMD37961.1 hypothetical protein SAMN04488029_3562 [Reichenbachiella faecimaris]